MLQKKIAKVTRENIWFSSRLSIYLILIYEIQIVISFNRNLYVQIYYDISVCLGNLFS